ncbi:hypothetical protein [Oceaniglobus trochenteri]|uniref:hypothetical protein n=1 Tax=Oceaniglobus trochenteri TaxID=2763260 RepID=UPI001CFFC751|nr:hypothetical protein [Oceaniglobus trochenteri]
MSDPVTNVEIEDVLSSIRRLVSVDSGRPKPVDPAPDSKLILTQDYRISPPVTPQEKAESVPAEKTARLAEDYTKTLERRIAELEAAVGDQAAEFEPDGSEDTTQHRPTAVLFPARHHGAAEAAQAKDNDGAVDLDVLISELEAENPTPDHDEPKGQHSAEDDAPGTPSDPEDRIEVLEAESHRKDTAARQGPEFDLSNDDAIIDEEMLRDMVAEIVRQELQGALGERITRNVRKLVRREIMRAISIRDFE